jgi:hypothetical protein
MPLYALFRYSCGGNHNSRSCGGLGGKRRTRKFWKSEGFLACGGENGSERSLNEGVVESMDLAMIGRVG